jgi:hypothetical protein
MLAVLLRVSQSHPPRSAHVEVNINLDLQHRPWHTDEHIPSEDESEDAIHQSVSESEEVDVHEVGLCSRNIRKLTLTNDDGLGYRGSF